MKNNQSLAGPTRASVLSGQNTTSSVSSRVPRGYDDITISPLHGPSASEKPFEAGDTPRVSINGTVPRWFPKTGATLVASNAASSSHPPDQRAAPSASGKAEVPRGRLSRCIPPRPTSRRRMSGPPPRNRFSLPLPVTRNRLRRRADHVWPPEPCKGLPRRANPLTPDD